MPATPPPVSHDDLTWYVDQLTEQRDRAYSDAVAARREQLQLAAEHAANSTPLAVAVVREEVPHRNRTDAVATWAAFALALSSLHLATHGRYGQIYDEQMPRATDLEALTAAAQATQTTTGESGDPAGQ